MLRLLVLATAIIPTAVAVKTVDIVVSLCREHNTRTAHIVKKIIETTANVTVHAYCKCGVRFPECTALPNVGREGHTFIHHMLSHFDRLADVTFFINGGSGSSGHRMHMITTLAGQLSADVYYADTTTFMTQPLRFQSNETSESFLARAKTTQCTTEANSPDVVCCPTLCKTYCCHLFVPSSCTNEYMVFQNQTVCEWRGTTEENYVGVPYTTSLRPASPPNFPLWLSHNWGIEFDVWDAIGPGNMAIFAASRAAIRKVSPVAWQRSLDALSDMNGGVEVMYLERAWRVILGN